AQKEATRLLAAVADGTDPLAVKDADRTAPTVSDLVERFLDEHVDVKLKPKTRTLYRGELEKDVIPRLGKLAVGDVTRADIAALHHRLRATPVKANNVARALSKMFNMAEVWGLRPDGSNPVRHVEKFRQEPRRRYLSDAEFGRLGEVLDAAERG